MSESEGHVSDSQPNGKSQLDRVLNHFSAFARTHTFDASWFIEPGGVKRMTIEMAPRTDTKTETVRLVEDEDN